MERCRVRQLGGEKLAFLGITLVVNAREDRQIAHEVRQILATIWRIRVSPISAPAGPGR
jgi:hypothetical protein